MKLKTSSLLIAATLFGAAVLPAQANDDAMVNLLKVLRDQGTITAQNYDLLVHAAKADKQASDKVAKKVATVEKQAANQDFKIITKGKIKIESGDGNWSFQPIGRVMWDAISVNNDSNVVAGFNKQGFNGTELRRARLGFEGEVYDWGYKFEADFATAGDSTAATQKGHSEIAIKDAFLSYGTKFGDNKFKVKFGQSQIAFGFNTAASSKYMTFMDRPWYADSALSPARKSGVAAKLSGHSWSLAASVDVGELKGGTTEANVDGTTFALRGTFVPFKQDKHHQVQVGAGYMGVSSNANGFSYKQHLVAHKDKNEIKAGHLISAANFNGADAFQVDALGIFGPFHALAEYNNYKAKGATSVGILPPNLGRDIKFRSYSVEAGYFLTGESMKLKHGFWDGITPKSSMGAWQIATRFENMNINDGVVGDDTASKWTVGINYYPTKNTRLMLDYDKVTTWKQGGLSSNVNNANPSAIKFRAQAKW